MSPIYVPQELAEDSWLHEDRFSEFRSALAYARTQSNAIPALAKITPEDAYHLYSALRRGETRTSVDFLRAARSVAEETCECTNSNRGWYTGRDGLRHCAQCDGLPATGAAT